MSDSLRLRYLPTDVDNEEHIPGQTTPDVSTPGSPAPTELDRARALLRQQRTRAAAFTPVRGLFQDPAWDILLGLFVAYEEGAPLTIDAVRITTGLSDVAIRRWMLALEHSGLITCWPQDAAMEKRSIGLSDHALTMMLRFLQDI